MVVQTKRRGADVEADKVQVFPKHPFPMSDRLVVLQHGSAHRKKREDMDEPQLAARKSPLSVVETTEED